MDKLPVISYDNLESLRISLLGKTKEEKEQFFVDLLDKQPSLMMFIARILELHSIGNISYELADGIIKGISLTYSALERQIEADEMDRMWD